jgi:replicative DNA helicase
MYYLISGLVTEDSFYVTKHGLIYGAISRLIKDDIPVDLVSLADTLGGKVTRSELVNIVNVQPSGANAEYHAKMIAEKYDTRKTMQSAQNIFDGIAKGKPLVEVIATAQKELMLNMPQERVSSNLYPEVNNIIDKLIDAHGEGEKPYIPTGFHKLDKHTKIRPGQLTLVAADSGEGKTSFMLSIARNMARQGKRPLYISLEMTRRAIIENVIAQELGLCHQDMIGGDLSEQDLKRLTNGAARFSNYGMGVLGGRWNMGEIRHQVITEKRERGIDCLFVDSLGKVKTDIKSDKPNIIYNEICSDLVDIGEEFNIPIILAHHLNKNSSYRSTNKRPTVDSLNEAGDRWTHNVLLIYREYRHTQEQALEDKAEIIVGKARDGKEGILLVGFNGPSKMFYELETHREPPAVMAGGKMWGN